MEDLDADFELAVALAEGGGGGSDLESQPEDGDLGDGFELAAALMQAAPPKEPMGFAPRSKATAAYARKAKELKRARGKIDELQTKLAEIRSRRFVSP